MLKISKQVIISKTSPHITLLSSDTHQSIKTKARKRLYIEQECSIDSHLCLRDTQNKDKRRVRNGRKDRKFLSKLHIWFPKPGQRKSRYMADYLWDKVGGLYHFHLGNFKPLNSMDLDIPSSRQFNIRRLLFDLSYLKNLSFLKLSFLNFKEISSSLIKTLVVGLQAFPHLKNIHISINEERFSCQNIKILCNGLQGLKHLDSLSLDLDRSTSFSEEGVEILGLLLSKLQGLQYLSLRTKFRFVNDPSKFQNFFFSLGELRDLISLNLDCFFLEKNCIDGLFNSLKNLTHLSTLLLRVLKSLFIDLEAVNLFTTSLQKLPSLSELGLRIITFDRTKSESTSSLPIMSLGELFLKTLTIIIGEGVKASEILPVLSLGNIKSLSSLRICGSIFAENYLKELTSHLRELPFLTSLSIFLDCPQMEIIEGRMKSLIDFLGELNSREKLSSLEIAFQKQFSVTLPVFTGFAKALQKLNHLRNLRIDFTNWKFLKDSEARKIIIKTIKQTKFLSSAEFTFSFRSQDSRKIQEEIDQSMVGYKKHDETKYTIYSL